MTIYNKHYPFLEFEGSKEWMLATQRWFTNLCVRQIVTFQDEALDSCQRRWMMSSSAIRSQEPFGAPNFAWALERVPCFVACIQTYGVWWMGLRFQFPLIWLPAEHYTPTYNVSNDWWKDVLLTKGYMSLGTNMAEEYDLAHLHTDHSRSNPDIKRQRATWGHAKRPVGGEMLVAKLAYFFPPFYSLSLSLSLVCII